MDYMNNFIKSYSKIQYQSIQPLFTDIINKIYFYTLNKINKQLNKLAQP